jgi:hypothetical protein
MTTSEEQLDQGRLFGPRLRTVIVTVALLSVLGTFASLLFGEKLTRPRSRGRDSFSTNVVGHRAFHDTLTALGFFVMRHRQGQFGAATAPLFFIEPPIDEVMVESEPQDLYGALSERVTQGLTTVVVLPKWLPEPGAEPRSARVSSVTRAKVQDLLEVLWSELDPEVEYHPSTLPVIVRHRLPKEEVHHATFTGRLGTFAVQAPWLQTFRVRDSNEVEVLLGTPEAALIVERSLPGEARLLVVSDPDLLHSYNMHRAEHAALWVSLLRDELRTDTVVIDEVLHGFGQRLSLGSALGSFPLVLLPLQALLLALLCAAAGAVRFGPSRRAVPVYGRGPREVIGVAASVFAAGRPASRLANAYVHRVLDDVAAEVGLTGRGRNRGRRGDGVATLPVSQQERDTRLDDLAERKGQPRQAAQLAHDAERSGGRGKRHDQDALRLAQRAWAFRASLLAEQKRKKGS